MPWLKLTILVFWYGQLLSLVLPCEQLAITRKICLHTLAEVTSQIVRWIINLAPFGILGLVFNTISENGVGVLADYGVLILVLVGTMAFVALVVNPIIAFFVMMGKNRFPTSFPLFERLWDYSLLLLARQQPIFQLTFNFVRILV